MSKSAKLIGEHFDFLFFNSERIMQQPFLFPDHISTAFIYSSSDTSTVAYMST